MAEAYVEDDKISEASQIVAPKRKVIKDIVSAESQASQVKKEELKKRQNKARGFFDEEAELGSDDEDNDDICKKINKGDVEENEEGLDSDLEGFVDKGDHEVISDCEKEAFTKFQQDLINDDRA